MLKYIEHPIRVVALKTGLSSHVIRAWEKRYDAVSPGRTKTNRRLYSDKDIERLILLRLATQNGWNIGQIAQYDTDQLKSLTQRTTTIPPQNDPEPDIPSDNNDNLSPEKHIEACLREVEQLNNQALEEALTEATVYLSQPVFLEQVIIPMMTTIGDRWRQGSIRVAQEHLATSVVLSFLGRLKLSYPPPESAPRIVVTTLAGQMHEIGAMVAAITAASEGWQVIYLGPNLPADEIAGAVRQQQATAVALSLVYPTNAPQMREEFIHLRRYVSDHVSILVGGRGATNYTKVLESINAIHLPDMQSFRQVLESLFIHST